MGGRGGRMYGVGRVEGVGGAPWEEEAKPWDESVNAKAWRVHMSIGKEDVFGKGWWVSWWVQWVRWDKKGCWHAVHNPRTPPPLFTLSTHTSHNRTQCLSLHLLAVVVLKRIGF